VRQAELPNLLFNTLFLYKRLQIRVIYTRFEVLIYEKCPPQAGHFDEFRPSTSSQFVKKCPHLPGHF
jgi:hypothetical protein